MLSRFFTDPLNGALLGPTYVKTRRYLCLANDGLSISLEAFCKKGVQLARLSSSLLSDNWLLMSPVIKAFQSVLLIEEGRTEEVVLLYSQHGFALWYLERDSEIFKFDLRVENEVAAMHVFALSWCDTLGKKFFHNVLGVATTDGILYAQSYRPAPGLEPMCYRVKLPCSHVQSARFSRVASNMVLCGVLDEEGSITFVELTATSHPRLVGNLRNPRKSALIDFLILRVSGSSALQLALAYADGHYGVAEVTDWKLPPESLSSHALSYHPQGARFIESELGIHSILSSSSNRVNVHEVSSGASLLSEPWSGAPIDELDLFINHTYRIESLGLPKHVLFAPAAKQTRWMSVIQKTVQCRHSWSQTLSPSLDCARRSLIF